MNQQLYKRVTKTIGLLTLVLTMGGGINASVASADKAAPLAAAEPAAQTAVIEFLDKDMMMGQADAPITLIEYASTTCSHCADFHNKTLYRLKEKYIDTGKAKFIFRHFPLNSLDLAASMISRCATEERYFPLLQLYFKQQSKWMTASDPSLEVKKLARMAGIGEEKFNQCLASKELQTYLLKVRQDGIDEFDIGGTPTLVINGDVHRGNMEFEDLDKILSKME